MGMDRMKKAARAMFTAGALLGATMTNPAEARDTTRVEQVEKRTLSEQDFRLLGLNAYHETRGEPILGQLAATQVTLARLLSGKYGDTLGKVIFAKNQYSWAGDEKVYNVKIDKEVLEDIIVRLKFYLHGLSIGEAVRQLSQDTGIPEHALFYKVGTYKGSTNSQRFY